MGVIVDLLGRLDAATAAALVVLGVVVAHVVPWAVDGRGLRAYPGPWLAQFSDLWLAWTASHGHRCETVHELHNKYGPFVRIAPNHISVAARDAIPTIYAHGSNLMKSNFYDVFVTIMPGLFNTRDRAAHARKRRLVAHVFSMRSVQAYQPLVLSHLHVLLDKWDALCAKGRGDARGVEGDSKWRGADGRVWFDCFPWFSYLSFDIIGDLCFGEPFGMLEAGKDAAPVVEDTKAGLALYGEKAPAEVKYHIPAVRVLHKRGAHTASVGVLRPFWRMVINRALPWYNQGYQASQDLTRMAIAAVARRIAAPAPDRVDILSKLQEGVDDNGRPISSEELTAEAQTLMLAGSDTTANTLAAVIYYLAGHPECMRKLQRELDDALATEAEPVPLYDSIKALPYLEAVVSETMRLHSALGQGLERVVPEDGLEVLGRTFAPGTVLSVPSYDVHLDTSVWGKDAAAFRPERWFEVESGVASKSFLPFSFGPRACIGRNLALMDIPVIVATVVRRYDFVLEDASKPDVLPVQEGFLRKPEHCRVGVKVREAVGEQV
ncbi:unnamed protein product [Peniophora sp. CBMAI 1063]|nr:unnamed protein product [Peniophora sp. CBMAI 1063]